MQLEQLLQFGPYRLDPQTEQLWRGKREVKVTPKAAAVLCSLVERAGQVVTKEELFVTVWPDTVVSEAALTAGIQELRRALGDQARKPRYIETVHRRGFRFLGKVVSTQQEEANQKAKGQKQKPILSLVEGEKVEHSSPAPSTQHP